VPLPDGLPPVVLVHGFASSFQRNWVEPGWVALLEDAGRTVVGVDLLGHGDADKPHDPAAYADLEDGVLRAFPDGAVDAVGFSLGARTLLVLASRDPSRFRRLVLGGVGDTTVTGRSGHEAGQDAMASAIETGEAGHPLMQAFARFAAGGGNDPKALAACLRRPHPPLDALERVTVPTLVVAGDRDELAGSPEALAARLPDARAVVLRHVDHLGAANDFGFIDAALDFLAQA
jgi:pimeloyl-ACP methyl ester carboxylesterase